MALEKEKKKSTKTPAYAKLVAQYIDAKIKVAAYKNNLAPVIKRVKYLNKRMYAF